VHMNMRRLAIDEIQIGPRRREELGGLEALAASIQQHGLIHPIVIDQDGTLVAGERRLKACQLLGWGEIDVRVYEELTQEERWAIELEENLHRKDLSEYERAKTMMALVETAHKLAQRENTGTGPVSEAKEAAGPSSRPDAPEDFRSTMERKSRGRGRPKEAGSYRDVGQRTGIPVATMKRAEAHVAAVEKYPELQGMPQAEALAIGQQLDQLPADARERQRAALRHQTSGIRQKASQQGASRTGTPRRRPKDPERWWLKAIHSLWSFREKTREPEALLALARHWSRDTVQRYLQDIRQVKNQLIAWERALEAMLSPEGNGCPEDERPLQPATMGEGKAASAARDGTSLPPTDDDQTAASGEATEETGLVKKPGKRAGSGPQDRGHAAAQASAPGKGPPAREDERRAEAPKEDIDQGGSPLAWVTPPDGAEERRRIALSRVRILLAKEKEPKLRAIARILNAERVPTVTGQGQWDHRKVARLLQADGVKGRNTTMKRRKKRTSAKTLRMRA
jgi:hypothetical protein